MLLSMSTISIKWILTQILRQLRTQTFRSLHALSRLFIQTVNTKSTNDKVATVTAGRKNRSCTDPLARLYAVVCTVGHIRTVYSVNNIEHLGAN